MRYMTRRRAVAAAAFIAVIPLSILAYQAWLRHTGNFRTVVAGQLYRSAQPTPERLRSYVEANGIKTVLNLRGKQAGVPWYDAERDTANALKVALVDFSMSAGNNLSAKQAKALVSILRHAQKPILVHCRTGADRSGLVSVIYASQVAHEDEEVAESQLGPIYGHFGIPLFSPTFAMDRSWEQLEGFFGIEGS